MQFHLNIIKNQRKGCDWHVDDALFWPAGPLPSLSPHSLFSPPSLLPKITRHILKHKNLNTHAYSHAHLSPQHFFVDNILIIGVCYHRMTAKICQKSIIRFRNFVFLVFEERHITIFVFSTMSVDKENKKFVYIYIYIYIYWKDQYAYLSAHI